MRGCWISDIRYWILDTEKQVKQLRSQYLISNIQYHSYFAVTVIIVPDKTA